MKQIPNYGDARTLVLSVEVKRALVTIVHHGCSSTNPTPRIYLLSCQLFFRYGRDVLRQNDARLVTRLNKVIRFMQSRGMTHLIIGCNAASTVIPYLKTDGNRIEGMIELGDKGVRVEILRVEKIKF